MVDRLAKAREAVNDAIDVTDEATIREQLGTIDEGLAKLSEPEERFEDEQQGERLETVESKLVGLGDRTDGLARERLEAARDHLDAYRREHAQDW